MTSFVDQLTNESEKYARTSRQKYRLNMWISIIKQNREDQEKLLENVNNFFNVFSTSYGTTWKNPFLVVKDAKGNENSITIAKYLTLFFMGISCYLGQTLSNRLIVVLEDKRVLDYRTKNIYTLKEPVKILFTVKEVFKLKNNKIKRVANNQFGNWKSLLKEMNISFV